MYILLNLVYYAVWTDFIASRIDYTLVSVAFAIALILSSSIWISCRVIINFMYLHHYRGWNLEYVIHNARGVWCPIERLWQKHMVHAGIFEGCKNHQLRTHRVTYSFNPRCDGLLLVGFDCHMYYITDSSCHLKDFQGCLLQAAVD